MSGMTERLFSYGTLRFPAVQHALFGRQVPTEDDALPGYLVGTAVITDEAVIATSGTDRHPILTLGAVGDVVHGACLTLTADDLAAADDYEVDDYVRVRVRLASGTEAWAYVAAI